METEDTGERQIGKTLSEIRADHVARYEFAADIIGNSGTVLDYGCGVGYGTHILAERGIRAYGVDQYRDVIEFAKQHYSHENAAFYTLEDKFPEEVSAVVCFEVIEHLPHPHEWLKSLRKGVHTLIASVPNEEVFPFKNYKFHHRHYTREEFRDMLEECGWQVDCWYGQHGTESPVEKGVNGRTTVVVATRPPDGEKPRSAPIPESEPLTTSAPRRVALLGLGPSLERYVDHVKRYGGRSAISDELWGINALGDIFNCDRVFHMDDMRVQEARAEASPDGNIATMVEWMRGHPGPVYTSQMVKGYPGLVEYPLEDVINSTGWAYFNSTAAYAIAYAIHIGVEELSIFGFDFTYPNAHHAEKGRACVEFWLGMAAARGIRIRLPDNTTIFDMIESDDSNFYGYDAVHVTLDKSEARTKVIFEPRDLPEAAEIEERYDHTRHPNGLIEGKTP